jgi:PAS domain S-box-containing protein
MPFWAWIALGALAILVMGEEIRLYRAFREFRKRDEIFQVVTENAADMIALVDMKGRRLYNSPSYKRVLGYSPAELSETSSFEQIHPDDRMRVLEAAREARESGVGKRLEYRIKHKDGSWRVLESIASTSGMRTAKSRSCLSSTATSPNASAPSSNWSTTCSTICSPDCRTAACSWTGYRTPLPEYGARRDDHMRCCLRTWITSRSSTTAWEPSLETTS